ncbi:NUDIX domain-containing protein [Haloplanus sp. GCM10025708]|uniref:NUDIX domain-containing protein n=1 Tax=Haloferacaceae TaxID=1644056 RepID=UPI00360CEB8F
MGAVVTCFLRDRGDVLLVRRSDGAYAGLWDGVSGRVEGDSADAGTDARRVLREVAGVTDATLVRAGDPLEPRDGPRERTVYPFLFDADEVPRRSGSRAVDARKIHEATPNAELAAVELAPPPAIRERSTVPGLWETYRRVAPTVATVRDDETHGSAWISRRALDVLRDAAAVADDWDDVAAVARDLRAARPSMAAVENRVNRVLSTADRTPDAVRRGAEAAIEAACDAGDEAAATAAERLSGTVATLSRSGTVLSALRSARPAVVVGESRPAREGVDAAERFAEAGLDATLTTDAALSALVGGVDSVLIGADAVLADGSVVNKVGTRALALSAARADVPVYAVAAAAKIRPDDRMHGESGDPSAVYDGDADVSVSNPVFDRTPADLITGVVTERGVLDVDDVAAVAAEHRRHAAWDDAE